jgi:hypothetical protein
MFGNKCALAPSFDRPTTGDPTHKAMLAKNFAKQFFFAALAVGAVPRKTPSLTLRNAFSTMAFCSSLGVSSTNAWITNTHGLSKRGTVLGRASSIDSAGAGLSRMSMKIKPTEPSPKEIPVETICHGDVRVDPFAWMKDDNWQKVLRDPSILRQDIRAYLEEENQYVDAILEPTKPLQEQLLKEMKGRIEGSESSVPTPDGAAMTFLTGPAIRP